MVSGLALSRVVDGMISVAATVAVLDSTESTVAAVRMIPMAVLGVFVVAAVQVSDQRFVLGSSALIRAASAVGLALIVRHGNGAPALVVVGVGIAGLASAPFRAGAGRLIATQIREDRLVAASAVFSRVDYGSVLVAPGLCGVLLFATNLATTFVITAALAVLLVFCVLLAPADRWPRPGAARAMRQVGSAARLVLSVKDARSYLAIRACARIALGIVGVDLAFFPARAGVQNAHVAFLQAALGVGAMVVALVPGRLPDRGGIGVLLVSVVILAAALLGLASFRPLALVSIALAIVGAADLAVHLASGSSLSRSLPTSAAAAGSGVADCLVAAGLLLGTIACPALVDAFGVGGACVVAAAVVATAGALLIPRLRRADTRLAVRRRSAAPVLGVLEKCRALNGLSPLNLELLAESGTAVVVQRGTLVIAEGSASDAVYVVGSGQLTVHVSGADATRTGRMVTLGPGDLFGEIGVLQGRARTASVIAAGTAELTRIPAEVFSAVLTADLGAAAVVTAGMQERLRRSHEQRE
jgi:Cyclic nucleotide-binding domain